MGQVVLTRYLVQEDAWEADRLITPRQVYQRDMRDVEEIKVLVVSRMTAVATAG
jgi:hypothetical protein